MKYLSADSLHDFEFHDDRMELVDFADGTLTVCTKYLNIHKSTEQNDYETDMEIELAQITFEGFSVKSFTKGGAKITDENGKEYQSEPIVVSDGKTAETKLILELQQGITVLEFGTQDGSYYMDACGATPWFHSEISFISSTVEWDNYSKIAWYEERNRLN